MAREGGGLEGGGRGAQRGGLIACVFAGDSICMRRRAAGAASGSAKAITASAAAILRVSYERRGQLSAININSGSGRAVT